MYICTQQYAFEAVAKKGVGAGRSACPSVSQSSFFISLFFNSSLCTETDESDERDAIRGDPDQSAASAPDRRQRGRGAEPSRVRQ